MMRCCSWWWWWSSNVVEEDVGLRVAVREEDVVVTKISHFYIHVPQVTYSCKVR